MKIYFILWMIAILQIMVYLYASCACLYGVSSLIKSSSPLDTLRNPFFGIKKTSLKTGSIVWCAIFIIIGGMLSEFYLFHFHGVHPFFFDLMNL